MLMHHPPHPGKIIRELCLDPLGLSVIATMDRGSLNARRLSTACKRLIMLIKPGRASARLFIQSSNSRSLTP